MLKITLHIQFIKYHRLVQKSYGGVLRKCWVMGQNDIHIQEAILHKNQKKCYWSSKKNSFCNTVLLKTNIAIIMHLKFIVILIYVQKGILQVVIFLKYSITLKFLIQILNFHSENGIYAKNCPAYKTQKMSSISLEIIQNWF